MALSGEAFFRLDLFWFFFASSGQKPFVFQPGKVTLARKRCQKPFFALVLKARNQVWCCSSMLTRFGGGSFQPRLRDYII
jgi:hypothetical protein